MSSYAFYSKSKGHPVEAIRMAPWDFAVSALWSTQSHVPLARHVWAAIRSSSRAALLGMLITGAQATWPCSMSTDALREELEAMLVTDQAQRSVLSTMRAVAPPSAEYVELVLQQQRADEANISRLREIIDECGWPRQSQVKGKAAAAAFLVLQHASLVDQERYVSVMRIAVEQGEARTQDLALLEDRILIRNGKPQKFGSQISWDRTTGKNGFHPIEDEHNVDRRRAAVGLGPLADYAKRFGFEYVAPGS